MGASNTSPKLSEEQLRAEIKKEYAQVALDPSKGCHFHTGCDAANIIGYDPSLYATLPAENIDSSAGTGNPFMPGAINKGDTAQHLRGGPQAIQCPCVRHPGHQPAGAQTQLGKHPTEAFTLRCGFSPIPSSRSGL